MLSLNVKYRTGFDPKLMEFKQDALVRDVITMIVSKHDLPLHYPYVLYNPQADPTTNSGWLRPDHETTLFSTPLRNNDIVELLCEPSPIYISLLNEKDHIDLNRIPLTYLNNSKKTGNLDFSEPLYKLLPTWVKFFPFKKKKKASNYCVLRLQLNENYAQVIGMLNINIPPFEANISPNGHLLLVSLDYFNRPASSVMNPTYVGYATLKIKKGENKYTKAKKYLLVQKYNILYYFNSRSSLSADGMIDLQYMVVTVKNTEVRLSLTPRFDRSLLSPTPDYVLESDVHNIKELVRRVWRHSASGAGKHVFGVSLAHLWDRKFSVDLPVVVTSCCEYIQKYGINTEGVFQDPGNKETMEMLRDEFDKGGPVDMDELNPDPHSVGQILKTYLVELPEPILTWGLYTEFWKVRNNTNNVMMLLSSLPTQNQLLVKYLSTFLLEFVRHAAANRITLHGLALYFTPCFLRPKEDNQAHDAAVMSSVVATLIANCESFTPAQRIRSLSKTSRQSMEVSSNFSPPFPLHNKNDSPPPTPPPRYSLRLEKIMELRAELKREPSNPSLTSSSNSLTSSPSLTSTSSSVAIPVLTPPPSLVTPPASPSPSLKHSLSSLTRPAPPSTPPSPAAPTSSNSSSRLVSSSSSSSHLTPSSSSSRLSLSDPPPSTPAPPSTTSPIPIAPPTLTPPPSLSTPPMSSTPPSLPSAPSPIPPRASTPTRYSPSLPRPVFVLPPSPNTARRAQGPAPDASAPPAAAAAYAAAAAMDAAADARAAALAALAALDFLNAGMSPPSSPMEKHGSVALGAPPSLPPLDTPLPPPFSSSSSSPPPAPPLSSSGGDDFGSSPPSDFFLGAPPPPPS